MIAQLTLQTAIHLTNPFSTSRLRLKRTTGAHLNTLRTIFHGDMEKTFSLSECPENCAENKTLNLRDLFPEGPVTDGILLLNRGQQECKSELIRLWGASGTPLDLCWIRLCKTHSSTPPQHNDSALLVTNHKSLPCRVCPLSFLESVGYLFPYSFISLIFSPCPPPLCLWLMLTVTLSLCERVHVCVRCQAAAGFVYSAWASCLHTTHTALIWNDQNHINRKKKKRVKPRLPRCSLTLCAIHGLESSSTIRHTVCVLQRKNFT